MSAAFGNNFAALVEEVKKISTEDKEELRFLLDRYLIEEKRDNIYRNYKESLNEIKDKKINYTGDIDKLKEMLKND